MSAPIDVLAVMAATARTIAYAASGLHAPASQYDDLLEARDAVADLIAAIIEDEARPTFVTLNYIAQRHHGEPEGPKWWEWRRKHLGAQGYILSYEDNNGCEYFILPAGMSDRTAAAFARVQGGAA